MIEPYEQAKGRITRGWTSQDPIAPGRYWWRRSWQWEPVIRTIEPDGTCYSHRYCQRVPAHKVGGEWGDKVEGT